MILLSLLTPTLPARRGRLAELLAVLEPQLTGEVELLVLGDNRQRSVGAKRNALMALAQGKFLCHLDDDDLVSPDFVAQLLPACATDVDLIHYDGTATLDDHPPFKVITQLGVENEQLRAKPGGGFEDVRRTPWHWCAWRADLARVAKFPDYHYHAEDWFWLTQVLPLVQTSRKLEATLFHYRYRAAETTFKDATTEVR